jgi:hypothetical protein
MRTSTKGLAPGVRVHRKGDPLYRAENGTVTRIEDHPTRGTIVWYRNDRQNAERPAPLAVISIIRKPRLKPSIATESC